LIDAVQCSERRGVPSTGTEVEPSLPPTELVAVVPAEQIEISVMQDERVLAASDEYGDNVDSDIVDGMVFVSTRISASRLVVESENEPGRISAASVNAFTQCASSSKGGDLATQVPGSQTVTMLTSVVVVQERICSSIPVADKHGRMLSENGVPQPGKDCSFVLGPIDHGFCFITVEKNPALNLPRVRVDGRKLPLTDQRLKEALSSIEDFVEKREPFTVTYDLRSVCIPNMRQLKMGMRWCVEHKDALDEGMQGVSIILSSWLIAKACNLVLSVLKPPQPIKICKDEFEAVTFLAAKCQTPRSWAPGTGTRVKPTANERKRNAPALDIVGGTKV